jgi:hypothetical protein
MRTLAAIAAGGLIVAGCAACSGAKHAGRRGTAGRPSSNPYLASLAYAKCLRNRGIPHPNPDKHGEFSLTAAQERRLQSIPRARRDRATKACFHNLAGLNNAPLSDQAHRRAIEVLQKEKGCLRGLGYEVGNPIVHNLSFGRAMFGFDGTSVPPTERGRRAEHTCEARVGLARKITQIINEDRRTQHPGGF